MKVNLIGGLILLFILGAILGIAGDKWLMCHKMHKGPPPMMMEHGCPPGGPMMKPENFILMMLKDRLNLNDEQFKKSEAIVKDTHAKLKNLKDTFHNQEKKLIEESFDLIKKDLAPEQQKKLEELQKEMKEKKGPPPGEEFGRPFPPCRDRMGSPPPPCEDRMGPPSEGPEGEGSKPEDLPGPEANVNNPESSQEGK